MEEYIGEKNDRDMATRIRNAKMELAAAVWAARGAGLVVNFNVEIEGEASVSQWDVTAGGAYCGVITVAKGRAKPGTFILDEIYRTVPVPQPATRKVVL